jgi:hypothetical protein
MTNNQCTSSQNSSFPLQCLGHELNYKPGDQIKEVEMGGKEKIHTHLWLENHIKYIT